MSRMITSGNASKPNGAGLPMFSFESGGLRPPVDRVVVHRAADLIKDVLVWSTARTSGRRRWWLVPCHGRWWVVTWAIVPVQTFSSHISRSVGRHAERCSSPGLRAVSLLHNVLRAVHDPVITPLAGAPVQQRNGGDGIRGIAYGAPAEQQGTRPPMAPTSSSSPRPRTAMTATTGCTASLVSNRGWTSVATLSNGRWTFDVVKPG